MNSDQSLSTGQEMDTPPTPGGCGWRVALLVVTLVLSFVAGSWFARHTSPNPASGNFVTSSSSFERPVVIQVSGAVKAPGVYELPFNARVYQAIAKAGGLLPDAEVEAINQADWVEDGSQIIIPSKKPVRSQEETTVPNELINDTPLSLSLNSGTDSTAPAKSTFTKDTKATPRKPSSVMAHKSSSKEPPKSPIDLNRATSEDLQQLPGVGPAMAERILEYRKDSQGFASVDDLDNVRGIGTKTLEKIRPFVVVNALPFQKPINN